MTLAIPTNLASQTDSFATLVVPDVLVGGEAERYLRYLDVTGSVRANPWSIRSKGLETVGASARAPLHGSWMSRLAVPQLPGAGSFVQALPGTLGVTYNSAFPHGVDDGSVWLGRGLTAAVSGGIAVRYGDLSLTLAPDLFWSENASFGIHAPGASTASPYGDAIYGSSIDRPQRFGDASFVEIHPGQSTLKLDSFGVEVGLSTANRSWGPASRYNLVLGMNAPGFAHAFIGSSRPRSTPIGSFHGQVLWGQLRQSDYAPTDVPDDRRFMTGWAVSYSPPGLSDLELGASRFYHLAWPGPGDRLDTALRPFEAFLSKDVGEEGREGNQLASVFARWAFPTAGFEVYGEFAREDYSYRFRDFVLEPGHTSGFMLGMAKVWDRPAGGFWGLRTEILNSVASQNIRVRYHGPFYVHHIFRQGHTHLGQPLGAPAAIGGGGISVLLDRYDGAGRWSASLSREVQAEALTVTWSGTRYPEPIDVVYAASAERLLFRGPLDLTFGLGAAYELNRNLIDENALNLKVRLLGTYRPQVGP